MELGPASSGWVCLSRRVCTAIARSVRHVYLPTRPLGERRAARRNSRSNHLGPMAVTKRHVVCSVSSSGIVENGEASLMPHLIRWLETTGHIRAHTRKAFEVPWLGRRVDLALLTGRGVTSAFELKLGQVQRVVEQASYNRLSFHRSWIVVGTRPKAAGLEWAQHLGLGVLVVRPPSVSLLLRPVPQSPEQSVVHRVRAAIATRAVLAS